MRNKIILILSIPLAAVVICISCVALSTANFYAAETLNWQAQSIGQDLVDLFLIIPCLIVTSFLAYRNNKVAMQLWGGVVLYLTYTFVLYCFEVHFNKLFILYCTGLGLSFYSFLYFLFVQYKRSLEIQFEKNPVSRFVAIYFIIIAALFYFIWLSEIIPCIIQNTVPKSIADTGLFTNGVHVLDLSLLLPAVFISAVLLLKGNSFGYILAPSLLSFFALMDLTIGILVIVMNRKEIERDLFLAYIMGLLAMFSLLLLAWYLNSTKTLSSKSDTY